MARCRAHRQAAIDAPCAAWWCPGRQGMRLDRAGCRSLYSRQRGARRALEGGDHDTHDACCRAHGRPGRRVLRCDHRLASHPLDASS